MEKEEAIKAVWEAFEKSPACPQLPELSEVLAQHIDGTIPKLEDVEAEQPDPFNTTRDQQRRHLIRAGLAALKSKKNKVQTGDTKIAFREEYIKNQQQSRSAKEADRILRRALK